MVGLLRGREQEDAVDLVDLDELDLDALVACGRQVLADVVGADRELAVAAVGEHGELDAGRAAVVEERRRSPRGSCGPCRGRRRRGRPSCPRAGSRASCRGRAAARGAAPRRATHVHVVAVEGDVERRRGRARRRCAPRSGAAGAARAGRRACGCRRARPRSRSSFRSMISCAIRESVRADAPPRRGAASRNGGWSGSTPARCRGPALGVRHRCSPFRPLWDRVKGVAAGGTLAGRVGRSRVVRCRPSAASRLAIFSARSCSATRPCRRTARRWRTRAARSKAASTATGSGRCPGAAGVRAGSRADRSTSGPASRRTASGCSSSRTARGGCSRGCCSWPAARRSSWPSSTATSPAPSGRRTGSRCSCWRRAASSGSSSATRRARSPGASPT